VFARRFVAPVDIPPLRHGRRLFGAGKAIGRVAHAVIRTQRFERYGLEFAGAYSICGPRRAHDSGEETSSSTN
jgi:hypothetical protein